MGDFFRLILIGIGLILTLGITFDLVDRIFECWFDKKAGPFIGVVVWILIFAATGCIAW